MEGLKTGTAGPPPVRRRKNGSDFTEDRAWGALPSEKAVPHSFPAGGAAPFFPFKEPDEDRAGRVPHHPGRGSVRGVFLPDPPPGMAYLFFFAVDEERRGKGLGSAALAALKERYAGKRLFLARERLDEPCDNLDQRMRRHAFYLRNGFADLPLHIQEGSVVYDVMSVGGSITPQEYGGLIRSWTGPIVRRLIKMEMTEI